MTNNKSKLKKFLVLPLKVIQIIEKKKFLPQLPILTKLVYLKKLVITKIQVRLFISFILKNENIYMNLSNSE